MERQKDRVCVCVLVCTWKKDKKINHGTASEWNRSEREREREKDKEWVKINERTNEPTNKQTNKYITPSHNFSSVTLKHFQMNGCQNRHNAYNTRALLTRASTILRLSIVDVIFAAAVFFPFVYMCVLVGALCWWCWWCLCLEHGLQ